MVWPTSISGNSDLYVAVNSLEGALDGAIDASVTTITLDSVAGFPTTGGFVTIDTELIKYTGISSDDLTGCTRAFDGTTATSHTSTAPVRFCVVAQHHNALKDEVIAIETSLDITASRAIVTDANKRLVASDVTATEVSYLDGVTSNIQTQLNAKTTGNTAITPGTATKITYDAKGLVTAGASIGASDLPSAIDAAKIADGSVSNTEFQFLDGVTSSVQTQLNAKQTTTLTDGKILIGNVSNVATAQTLTGDVTVSNAGVTAIASGVIVNADVKSDAAIAESKLALTYGTSTLNTSISNHIGDTTDAHAASAITNTPAGNIAATTVQAAINELDSEKQVVITGAATTVTTVDLTASRALQTNSSGKIEVSSTCTPLDLGRLAGVTSGVQSQLDGKMSNTLADGKLFVGNVSNVATPVTFTGDVTVSNAGVTAIASGVIVNADIKSDAAIDATKIADGTISNTEFQYLNGLGGNIQTQLNNKLSVYGDAIGATGYIDFEGGVVAPTGLAYWNGNSEENNPSTNDGVLAVTGSSTSDTVSVPNEKRTGYSDSFSKWETGAYLGLGHLRTGNLTVTQLDNASGVNVYPSVAGSTTYEYYVQPLLSDGTHSSYTSKILTTGNATLNSSNYNLIVWNPTNDAANYGIFRNQGGPNTGYIQNLTLSSWGKAPQATYVQGGGDTYAVSYIIVANLPGGNTIVSSTYGPIPVGVLNSTYKVTLSWDPIDPAVTFDVYRVDSTVPTKGDGKIGTNVSSGFADEGQASSGSLPTGTYTGIVMFTKDAGVYNANGDTVATGNTSGVLRFTNGGGTISITPPTSLSGSFTLTLPTSDGTSNQVLTTDGSGVLSWTTPGSSSPLTTKGDIYTYSTTNARLAKGTDGYVLSADSAETTGLKWVAAPNDSTKLPLAGGTMTGDITMDNQKGIVFKEATGNGISSVTIKAPASLPVTGDITFTLPTDYPSTSNKFLTSTVAGVMSWETVSASIAWGSITGTLAAQTDLGSALDAKLNKSYVSVKGNLVVGNDESNPQALSVGTNDYVLTADSSSTLGIKWAAVPVTGANTTLSNLTDTVAINKNLNNFSAGTITASLTGAASLNLLLTGGTLTGDLIIDDEKLLKFNEEDSNGSNFVALKAPAALTGDQTYTLPTAYPTTGQVLSSTDAGVMSWVNASSVTPANLTTSTTGVTVSGTGAVLTAATVDIQTASVSQPGLISATDWGTFNTGATTAAAALPSASFTDAAVTSKLLTGFTSGAGAVAGTDTILQAINKLDGNGGTKLALAGGTMTGDITLDNGKGIILNELDANGSNYVKHVAADSLDADTTYTWPKAPASNKVLQSTSAGVLSWETAGSGSSPLTTKGDIYTYGTADARLAVGTNGQVLTADSAQTNGIKWADQSITYRENYVVGTASANYTGSSTVFDMSGTYVPGSNNLLVTLDGDVQTIGASIDYVETDSNTVTFNNALVTGQKVSFIYGAAPTASAAGTVNSGTQYQLAYYAAAGTAVSGSTAITANKVLVSDSVGLPIASSVTPTTLGYLDATSSVQTQLDARSLKSWELTTRLSADYTNNSNPSALSDVTGLDFAIAANEVWYFEFNLVCTGVSGGGRVAINGPSGATLVAFMNGNGSTATGFTSSPHTTLDAVGPTFGTYTTASGVGARIAGTMVCSSTAGTVQLRCKNVTSGNTFTIHAGSYLIARRIS